MKGRPRLRVAPCKFCNKEFKRQEHLERHLRTHNRERPFGCACGRMFSRQDLLSRHCRLSQCSDPNANTTTHRLSATHRPPQSANRTSSAEPAISPPLSNSSHGQTPSFSYDSQPGAAAPFVFEGFETVNSAFPSQTSATQTIDQRPPTTMTNFALTGHSQQQFMGKFSIHDPVVETEERSPGGVSRGSGVTTYGNENMEMAMETAQTPDFMQLQGFDTDFFSNETDMISDYLMGAFPPMDYQAPMMENAPGPDGYSAMGGHPEASLPDAPNSNNREPAVLGLPSSMEQSQRQAVTIQSHAPDHENVVDQTDRERDGIGGSLDAIDDIIATNPWAVSALAFERLSAEVAEHRNVLPETFNLPGRQTLSRYVASYIRGFHPHLPFIHLPTTCLDSMTPMLLLTLATVGSFYGFEHTHGYAMYFISKAVITQKLEERRRASTLHLLQSFPSYAELPTRSSRRSNAAVRSGGTSQPASPAPATVDIELLQALLILVLTMSWLDGPLAEDALAMSSQLTALTREALRSPPWEIANETWRDWSREEERRRTLLSAYFVLNIQTICFNVPPQLTNSEINLPLPCSEAEFKAPNSAAWRRLQRKDTLHCVEFQDCLKQLLSGKPLAKEVSISGFGNYMLIQGLLMQIYSERQTASALLSSSSSLATATIKLYDAALGAWQSCWDSAIESALDPSSPHGPLAFNSTAILRLAHIHLGVGLHSQCALRSRDPEVVAQAFEPHRNPIPLRSAHLDQAVLHAIYALRIPVRVGIAFVARGRTGHWSVQHAISNFACALLLTHWLENIFCLVSSDGLEVLRQEERRLLSMIERLIEETHLDSSLGPRDCYPSRIRRLAVAAVRLWAETCKGIQVYEIVHVVGETLSLVAESIESRLQT